MIDYTQSIQVIPVDAILKKDPRVLSTIEKASRILENYWRNNVNRYFSKSLRYKMSAHRQDRMYISPGRVKTNQWRNAIKVRYLPYQSRVHVYIGQVFNPKDMQDYSVRLMEGYPAMYGVRYSASMDMLVRDPGGKRRAMSADPYRRWITEFLGVVDGTMETLASDIATQISDEVVKSVADRIQQMFPEEF
jgi:hypothetical protein